MMSAVLVLAVAASATLEWTEADETALLQVTADVKARTSSRQQPAEPLSGLFEQFKDLASAAHNVLSRSPGSFIHPSMTPEALAPRPGPIQPVHAPLMQHLSTRPLEVVTAARIVADKMFGSAADAAQ
eukprot:CAMPEP_0171091572 /NCGR_PEP_ID=MMETSP0766_2-20121228/34120_1 /TAXON_ID=439317 /ORGANISM="Gambierdiscus australes, Strain CAWD 149" /LENGTH=127 /DNA_ID=CAMNT_0011549693 /DNA_START=70 /DNA_END=453 /DNA_ORIENTATION=-